MMHQELERLAQTQKELERQRNKLNASVGRATDLLIPLREQMKDVVACMKEFHELENNYATLSEQTYNNLATNMRDVCNEIKQTSKLLDEGNQIASVRIPTEQLFPHEKAETAFAADEPIVKKTEELLEKDKKRMTLRLKAPGRNSERMSRLIRMVEQSTPQPEEPSQISQEATVSREDVAALTPAEFEPDELDMELADAFTKDVTEEAPQESHILTLSPVEDKVEEKTIHTDFFDAVQQTAMSYGDTTTALVCYEFPKATAMLHPGFAAALSNLASDGLVEIVVEFQKAAEEPSFSAGNTKLTVAFYPKDKTKDTVPLDCKAIFNTQELGIFVQNASEKAREQDFPVDREP